MTGTVDQHVIADAGCDQQENDKNFPLDGRTPLENGRRTRQSTLLLPAFSCHEEAAVSTMAKNCLLLTTLLCAASTLILHYCLDLVCRSSSLDVAVQGRLGSAWSNPFRLLPLRLTYRREHEA